MQTLGTAQGPDSRGSLACLVSREPGVASVLRGSRGGRGGMEEWAGTRVEKQTGVKSSRAPKPSCMPSSGD